MPNDVNLNNNGHSAIYLLAVSNTEYPQCFKHTSLEGSYKCAHQTLFTLKQLMITKFIFH